MAPHPRKRFGQHWLRSEKVLQRIVAAADLSAGDRVLEIGPGQGVLTRSLLEAAEALLAIEIDTDLCRALAQKLGNRPNFLLLQGDFLELNWQAILNDFPAFQNPRKVVANIPYYITGPILERLLGAIGAPNPQPFDRIVLLIQKEGADRLCATPGSRGFGALSGRVQYLAECEWVCAVPPHAFFPPPKVESAVVCLRLPPFTAVVDNPRQFETLVKLGFATKRKMLRNNLKSVIDRDRLSHLLEKLEVNPQARAEDLSVEQWVMLSNSLTTPCAPTP